MKFDLDFNVDLSEMAGQARYSLPRPGQLACAPAQADAVLT